MRIASLILFLAVAGAVPAQSTQTLPVGLDLVAGGSGTSFPFNQAATHIWHWIYDTVNFNATSPILITAVSVRPLGNSVAGTFPNIELTLASATINWTVGSSGVQTFANNMGPDAAVVFNGSLVVPGGVNPSPAPWHTMNITPFLYDPTLGADLIIQVRTPGPGNYAAFTLDGVNNGNATRYGHRTNAFSPVSDFNNPAFVPVTRIDYLPATGFVLEAQTSGGGVGDLTLTGVFPSSYPAATNGFTLVSFTPANPQGSGPLGGLFPDAVTWPIFDMPALVGNPLRYITAVGFYPDVPFVVGPGALSGLAGTTADFVQLGFDGVLNLVFVSNVARATF